MSVQAITAALAVQGVTPSEKLLLIVLCNYANGDMECWPSQARLARDTCLSVRTMVRLFLGLQQRGYLTRSWRPNRKDGTRSSHLVKLTMPSAMVALGTPIPSAIDGLNLVPPCPKPSATVAPKPSLNQEREPSSRARSREPVDSPAPAHAPKQTRAEMAAMMRALAKEIKGPLQ